MKTYDHLIDFNDFLNCEAILREEVRELRTLYVHSYFFVCSLLSFLYTVIWYQVFLSKTNN